MAILAQQAYASEPMESKLMSWKESGVFQVIVEEDDAWVEVGDTEFHREQFREDQVLRPAQSEGASVATDFADLLAEGDRVLRSAQSEGTSVASPKRSCTRLASPKRVEACHYRTSPARGGR